MGSEHSRWVPLGDVSKFVNGDRGKNYPSQTDYVQQGIPFISAADLIEGRVNVPNTTKITEEAYERLGSGKIVEGDILFCLRGSLGKIARVRGVGGGAIASSLVIIRSLSAIDSDFLFYVLSGPLGKSLSAKLNNGSVQGNISAKSLQQSLIPLPPLAEQKRIAHILGTLDDKIELNRRMNATLEAMARALFQSWFVDFDPVRRNAEGGESRPEDALFPDSFVDSEMGEIPKGWRAAKIKDCCKQIQNGGTPRRNEPRFWEGGGIPWLASGEVRQAIITTTESFITDDGLAGSSAKWVPAFSTVVALYGVTAGQVSFTSSALTTNQAVCALIPKKEFVFFNYFTMRKATAELENKAVGSAQQNISKGIVEETEVVLPPLQLVERFTEVVSPLFDRWISNLHQSRTLAALRDASLPKLLSGELGIN